MPLHNNVIHPRLFERLGRTFWRDVINIQQRTDPAMRNVVGELETDQTLNPWIAYPGHSVISCNIDRKVADVRTEIREPLSTFDAAVEIASLNGYWPLIETGMRAVDAADGTVYNIRGVIHGATKEHTELELELIA